MARTARTPIRRDWLSKTLAGIFLGVTLALAASGIFSDANAGMPLPIRGQLAMWMVPPIWFGVLGFVYFFASGMRAWLWLGGLNVATYGVWLALRSFQ